MKRKIGFAIIMMAPLLAALANSGYAENLTPVSKETPVTATVNPPAAPVATPAPEVVSNPANDTISLDFKDAEITTVLRVLSMKSNVNIVTGPEVKGLVSVRLDDVPWQKALEVILRTYDYVYERDGNIIRVTSREKMKAEPVETKTFVLNYSKATEMQTAIQDILSERGRVKVSERSNMLVVTDIPTNVYRIGEVIKKLDQMTSQAFVDSKIVRTEAGVVENMGIQWSPTVSAKGSARPTTFPFTSGDNGTPRSLEQFFPIAGSAAGTLSDVVNTNNGRGFLYPKMATNTPTFSYGTLDFASFSATLNFLKNFTNAKVMSNPRITVLNNQTAHIQVGDQVPLPTYERNETTGSMVISGFTYRDTGVVLNVTPHINSTEEILVDLKPEVSVKNGTQDFGVGLSAVSAPIFSVTQAQTQLLIRSGQTIAIGGLLTDNHQQSESKVPYLADIPLVGKLFRAKRQGTAGAVGPENSKVETLFFVTVTTVDTQGQPVVGKVDRKNQSQDAQVAQSAVKDAAKDPQSSEKKEAVENTTKKAAT